MAKTSLFKPSAKVKIGKGLKKPGVVPSSKGGKAELDKLREQSNQASKDSIEARNKQLENFMNTLKGSEKTIDSLVKAGIDADFSPTDFMKILGGVFGRSWENFNRKLRQS